MLKRFFSFLSAKKQPRKTKIDYLLEENPIFDIYFAINTFLTDIIEGRKTLKIDSCQTFEIDGSQYYIETTYFKSFNTNELSIQCDRVIKFKTWDEPTHYILEKNKYIKTDLSKALIIKEIKKNLKIVKKVLNREDKLSFRKNSDAIFLLQRANGYLNNNNE